ncbi:helix-turn-helix domain-containing protein [Raoultella planticola]|uniref:helix-turn-helix domain-containing protein n=1 Tax=Raoultella planticola TaxID=575 RepID=UPI0009076EB0|nr:helix-turn-helix domain-containing protein [Raoultella planticola]
MSSRVQGFVWDACAANGITGAKLLIMVRLADYSNDDGISYPGIETISRQLGLAESTVYGALAQLEKAGWVRRQGRRNGNRRTSNLYFLNVERLEYLAAEERTKIRAMKAKIKANFLPPESEGTDFEPPEFRASSGLEPPDSGVKGGFEPPDSGGDPQVLKHDPQVKDLEPQGKRMRTSKKSKFDPLTARPEKVSPRTWSDWVAHREEIGKPLTETTCRLQVSKLSSCRDPNAVINLSITNGWAGLFPDKIYQPYVNRLNGRIDVSTPDNTIPPGFKG